MEEYRLLKRRLNEKGEEVFEYEEAKSPPFRFSWKSRLILWGTVALGIAAGTVLFLFFLALFVYVFIPLLAIAFLWAAFRSWQIRRSGRF